MSAAAEIERLPPGMTRCRCGQVVNCIRTHSAHPYGHDVYHMAPHDDCTVFCAKPTGRGDACLNRKHPGPCFWHDGSGKGRRPRHRPRHTDRGRGYTGVQPYELLAMRVADLIRLRIACTAIQEMT